MTRKAIFAAGLATTALLLSSCGNPADGSGTERPTSTAHTEDVGDRGNVVKKFGEEASITDPTTGDPVVTFTINSIGPAQCNPDWDVSGYPVKPRNLVTIDLEVSTAPELAESELGSYIRFDAGDFTFVDSKDITHDALLSAAAFACPAQTERIITDTLAPGSNYAGKITVDLPEPHGTLVYQSTSLADGSYEWNF